QQDERRGVGRLEAEGEIEEDEGIDVEARETGDIEHDPDGNEDRLSDEEGRRAKKPRERLSLQGKPVVTKNAAEMQMRAVEAIEMVRVRVAAGDCHLPTLSRR